LFFRALDRCDLLG